MQLRKMTLMIAALGLALTACPGGGREDLSCTADTDCSEDGTEICHPQAKVCVQTCTQTTDCPDSAKSCEAISSSNTQKICKCSTDALCQTDERVTDASTLSCDTTYRVCKSTGTGGGQTPPGAACTGEGQSTCGYGQFCSNSVCTAVAAPTCANFDPAQGGREPKFNASTSTGPIIYSVTQTSFAQDSFCGNGTSGSTGLTVKARVKAYTTGAAFPSAKSDLPGLFYVTVNGNQTDGSALIRPSEYSVQDGGKRAEFTMNFCPGSSATQLTIGLYFTGGNEICAVFNR